MRSTKPGHEASDVNVPAIVSVLIFLAFSAFVIHAGVWAWLKELRSGGTVDAATNFVFQPSSLRPDYPHLQTSPKQDYAAYRRKENALLSNYAWVDRTAGIVRIPIEQAIDELVAQGIPRWRTGSVSPLQLQQARALEKR